jgi:hypothetical protein
MTDPKNALALRREELLRERERLQEKITQVDEKIRAVDFIVADPSLLQYLIAASPGANGGTGAYVELGLRAAIRLALTQEGPMKPSDVTEVLAKGGFVATGNMDLRLRVSQEMHRMKSLGQLKRLPSGKYKCVERQQATEAEETLL